MSSRQIRSLLAVLFPLLVLGGWALYHHNIVTRGDVVRLGVTGYDPRDLLAGHYLTYRVVYTQNPCAGVPAHGERGAVCFAGQAAGTSRVIWSGPPGARPGDCKLWLQGLCSSGRFEAGIERYFFSERYARTLAVAPPNAEIEVRLDGFGGGVVSNFFVDGLPLAEYLKRRSHAR